MISYRRKLVSLDKDEIIRYVIEYYGINTKDLSKTKRPLLEKKIIIYLLKKLTGLTNKEIGDEFGISYSAVSKTYIDVERLMLENKSLKREVTKLISHFKG